MRLELMMSTKDQVTVRKLLCQDHEIMRTVLIAVSFDFVIIKKKKDLIAAKSSLRSYDS